MDFWSNVKRIINERKISQAEMSEGTGIHIRSIQNWFYRGTLPDVEQAYAIAKYLGVTVEYLLTGSVIQGLSKEESEVLTDYSKLPPVYKDAVKELIIKLSTPISS